MQVKELKPCTRCGGPKEERRPRARLCAKCRATPRVQTWCSECHGPNGDGGHPSYCSGCWRRRQLRRKYGLTDEQIDALPTSCQLCGSTETLCVDHDHQTGIVRGVLCLLCNSAAERVDTVPGWLGRMADYLQESAAA